ncbi:Phox/Bem1p [Artemisia annua]|uniref:Phox/Bem1p n=1 Tax=Artemisia annua TaxID=35608 RepID=A0A2U1Q8V9_ARTAN|nr:Phox/Bem1p [Artemisia annua]
MDNNTTSYSSYPDSNASSSTPRSRDLDLEYDADINYKVKLMCSYGGKILPRPHDHFLTYIGGDTKILSVDRNLTFHNLLHKLSTLSSSNDNITTLSFKYQLPGEDLDALISVTNDEDLEHMMCEYDRIFKASVKPVRLRLFLFPLVSGTESASTDKTTTDQQQQWFVDALNAVQISSSSSPVSENNNPDYLFGFDKASNVPVVVQQVVESSVRPGSDVVASAVEVQKHAPPQQMQINMDPRAYYGDYYAKIQAAGPGQPRYWQDQRHMTTGGYPMSMAGTDSPVYLIPSSTGVYPSAAGAAPVPAPAVTTMRPVPQVGQGQAYYGMQRMVNPPEFYREQPMYGTMAQPQVQQPKVGAYQETLGMVRPQAELGYGHVGQLGPVGVDAMGRQVYYTASQGGMGPTYQPVVAAADMRQGPGLTVNQEGKMVVNPNKIP